MHITVLKENVMYFVSIYIGIASVLVCLSQLEKRITNSGELRKPLDMVRIY